MHFRTLAAVQAPITIEEDKAKDLEIAAVLAELKARKDAEKDNIMLGVYMEELKNLRSSFARAVNREIVGIMDFYSADPINPEYLSFEDYTEELRKEYNSTADCIKLAQGKIVEANGYPLWGRFVIRNGKVFQREAGPIKHEKRTKRAKRMRALPDYHRKKLYASFEDYAENERGVLYDEEHKGYGVIHGRRCFWSKIRVPIIRLANAVGVMRIVNPLRLKDISGYVLLRKRILSGRQCASGARKKPGSVSQN